MTNDSPANLQINSNKDFELSGKIEFLDIPLLLTTFNKNIKNQTNISVDLSKIQKPKSVVLSLLLEMHRQANSLKVAISFINVPDKLREISKLNGVDSFVYGSIA